jgi:hypothetical protein
MQGMEQVLAFAVMYVEYSCCNLKVISVSLENFDII